MLCRHKSDWSLRQFSLVPMRNCKVINDYMKGPSQNIRRPENGAVLVLMLLLTIVFLGVCALVVDLGRMFIVVRELQNDSDASSLAGVNALHKHTAGKLNDLSPYFWQQVKPRVRGILESYKILSTEMVTDENTFSDEPSESSKYDLPGFKGTVLQTSGSKGSPIWVKVERGIECYQGGTRTWVSLEPYPKRYCLSNAVHVDIKVRNVPFYFAKIFGVLKKDELYRRAVAHIRPAPPGNCFQPLCSEYYALHAVGDEPDKLNCNPLPPWP